MDIYTGAMGMISFQGKLNVVGNNIANAKTNGYKTDKESFKVFEETFMRIKENGNSKRVGSFQNQVYLDQVTTNFDSGTVTLTGRNLDFSIQDIKNEDGSKNVSFFVVEQNGQDYLTRNGHYTIDHERNLATTNGAYVLDINGERIQMPTDDNYYVQPNGEIRSSEDHGLIAHIQVQQIHEDNLGFLEKSHSAFFKVMTLENIEEHFGPIEDIVANFDQYSSLQKIFKDVTVLEEAIQTGQMTIFEAFQGELHSNMLETSNVDLGSEMVEMMVAQKGFQASQKVTSTFDKINEKAMNELGR